MMDEYPTITALAGFLEQIEGSSGVSIDTDTVVVIAAELTALRAEIGRMQGLLNDAARRNRNLATAKKRANLRADQAKIAERERIAKWHVAQADAAMNSLHCGSENSEYRDAGRASDFHRGAAAAIREGR